MANSQIYIAYNNNSARDRAMYHRFIKMLQPTIDKKQLNIIKPVSSIDPYQTWSEVIKSKGQQADLIIFLVSSDYLAHKHYKEHELPVIKSFMMENKIPIHMVLLTPCDLESSDLDNWPLITPQKGDYVAQLNEYEQEEFWLKTIKNIFFKEDRKPSSPGADHCFYLNEITISQFKCFKKLNLKFTDKSVLGGRWHCIAGINGTGKSSILEAICLALLGHEKAQLIGPELIGRKCRTEKAVITATLINDITQEEVKLQLPLQKTGVDHKTNGFSEKMKATWEQLENSLFISFGATRDFSENKKPEDRLGEATRRHLTLFDPLEPPVDDVKVLKDINRDAFLNLLNQILNLLPEELSLKASCSEFNQLQFSMNGRDLPLLELPSGLRSLVICFTGIIREWCRIAPQKAANGELAKIQGIVLLDEIGLHLHPKLQRMIVPILRERLPKLQWIVTTHSPLVLSSFDQEELTWLNPDQTLKEIDRYIMGMSVDQIFRNLMEIEPESMLVEKYRRFQEALKKGETPSETIDPEILERIMFQNIFPELTQKETQKRRNWWKEKVAKHKEQNEHND